ncbi:hypothetical protein FH972_017760 [Carpinus fangiana]|uniref:Bulb-type lectin domain-containing protein n=1 Tax=Carpinus fangiana TaxID=176857 RepID=A0A5N6RMW2_9ROSI|nr:hypothetical protein FH972_017760 [Carpinus fangiana]
MMPILLFPFLLLSAIFAQQGQYLVKPGSFLTPTTNPSWPSPSGLYAFGFYKQGSGYAVGIFLAGLPQKTVVWTANRDKPPVPADSKLNFTSDGRLVLQSAQGAETLIASAPEGGASSASMLNSGNFVINNSANQMVWQSFSFPTDTFLPTQNLSHGQVLYSSVSNTNKSTGIFLVLMQEDGWLAMYPVGTPYTLAYGYGGVGISGQKNDVVLQLEDNGHLYLINGDGNIIVNMTNGYPAKDVYRLTIDFDGILRLYSHDMNQNGDWTVKWINPNDDICKPKGLCGFNRYCVVIDLQVGCNCLPQFEPVNVEDKSSGCQRNFSAESCEKDRYTIEPVPNTVWENNNYSIIISTTQDNCKEACLQDCNCEAALFKDGECTKQRLPLRFGRRVQSDSTVALIKVGKYSTPTIDGSLPKESKKEHYRLDILIVGVSLLAFALVVMAISGIAVYKYRSVDHDLPEEEAILEEWVYQCFESGELGKLVHNEVVDKKQLERMVKVGLWCILDEPSLRPSMKKVLLMLEGTVDIPTPPSPTSFLSTI